PRASATGRRQPRAIASRTSWMPGNASAPLSSFRKGHRVTPEQNQGPTAIWMGHRPPAIPRKGHTKTLVCSGTSRTCDVVTFQGRSNAGGQRRRKAPPWCLAWPFRPREALEATGQLVLPLEPEPTPEERAALGMFD